MKESYQTEDEIDAVVSGFEQCTTGKSDFTHLSHLTVAVYYLRNSPPEETFQKMTAGLFRFLDHHGVDRAKYDAELTRSWIALVQNIIEQLDSKLSLVAITNTVLERLGDSRIAIQQKK